MKDAIVTDRTAAPGIRKLSRNAQAEFFNFPAMKAIYAS